MIARACEGQHFSFHASISYIFCFIVCGELLLGLRVPLSDCSIDSCHSALRIPELPCRRVQERDKKNSSGRDFTLNIAALLKVVFKTLFLWSLSHNHRLLQEVVIQTQISLNVTATSLQITVCHNLILSHTASSQKVRW